MPSSSACEGNSPSKATRTCLSKSGSARFTSRSACLHRQARTLCRCRGSSICRTEEGVMVEYALADENEDIEVELTAADQEKAELEANIVYEDDDPNLVKTFLAVDGGKEVLKRIAYRICYAFTAA